MALLADRIEQLILDKFLEQKEADLILRRNELAEELECAPSQISYVLSTRFSNDRGFKVKSKRGLGGFVTITKLIPQNEMIETSLVVLPTVEQLPALQTEEIMKKEIPMVPFEEGVPRNIQEVDRWIGVLLYKNLINEREARMLHDAFASMFKEVPRVIVARPVNLYFKTVMRGLGGQ